MAGVLNIFLLCFLAAVSLPLTFGLAIPIYCVTVFVGAQKRIAKARTKLKDTLMDEETLISQGMQRRPFAFFSRRKLIAITNSRIIMISRGLLGGFTMRDFQWKDLHNAQISENVLSDLCGSNLSFEAMKQAITIPGVENGAATAIYKRAQSEEQAWEEKRRIRHLEDKRAAAGGVVLHTSPSQLNNESTNRNAFSVTEEIEKAKKLLDSGAINDVEFQEIKSKILSRSF
jgi:hypothetical protein